MPPLDLEPDLNKICHHLIRLLRNRNNTRHIENDPSAYHELLASVQEVLAAVQDIPKPRPLLTPASTPLTSQDSPEDFGSDSQANEHESDVFDPDCRGLSAIREQKIGCVDSHDQISRTVQHENLFVDLPADDFEAEHPNDDSHHSADLDVWSPSNGNDTSDSDDPQDKSHPQTAALSTSKRADTTQDTSLKRKKTFENDRPSKRAHIKTKVAADGGSEQNDVEHQGPSRRREVTDALVRKAAVFIQRMWRGKCARRRYEEMRQVASSTAAGRMDQDNTDLCAIWQTYVRQIKSIAAIEDCQRFCYKVRHPVTSLDIRPDQDALEGSGGLDNISARDRRLKQLKFLMDDVARKEKSLETPRIVLQVSRRVHLVELTASYEEALEVERASKKQGQPSIVKRLERGQPSVRERFVDVLFPHTIPYKTREDKQGEQGSKEGRHKMGKKSGKVIDQKGRKRKKTETMNDQKDQQASGEEIRTSAEATFDYWIRLGRPLWRMSQRYGLPILVMLPKEVTETSLHRLRKGQDQDIINFIDSCHPGLKEQICNLSSLLPGIIASDIPSNLLVIETLPHDSLSDYTFEELFQFSNDCESSTVNEPPPKPSQMPIETVDAPVAYAPVGPSDQADTVEQLASTQGAAKSVQSITPDPYENFQLCSHIAKTEDGDLSNSFTDYSGVKHPSSEDDQKLNQQISNDIDDLSCFQDSEWSIEPQSSQSWADLDPRDYFVQDDDWRGQQPSDNCGGEPPDSQYSGPQSLVETEAFDFGSFVNCSP